MTRPPVTVLSEYLALVGHNLDAERSKTCLISVGRTLSFSFLSCASGRARLPRETSRKNACCVV
jgi:hypothetical protein